MSLQDRQKSIAAFLQEGDHFRVTTEKAIELLPGAPMPRVIKRSSYSIIIRGALAAEAATCLAKIECPPWAVPSLEYDGCVEHKCRPELYVLARLDKKSGFGTAEFYAERETEPAEDSTVDVIRETLDKAMVAQVKKYIPPFDGKGIAFPLPLRSILEIDAPDAGAQGAQGEKDLPWDK